MAKAYASFLIGLARTDAEPLIANEKFATLEAATTYATTDSTAYPGQLISVVTTESVTAYQIQNDKSLKKVGSAAGSGTVMTAAEASTYLTYSDAAVGQVIMIANADGSVVMKKIVSNEGTLSYSDVTFSNTTTDLEWKAI